MFSLDADDGSVRKKRYESPIPADTPASSRPQAGNALDNSRNTQLHKRLLGFYTRELDRQSENRHDMAVDADMYDNIQWTEEQTKILNDRGQSALVFNVTAVTVDWVIGTEKRARTDFKVLPRRKEEGKPAQRKSELLKYLSDVNRTGFHVSRSFEDAAKLGVGWMEDGYQGDDEGEPLFSRYESWRNMLWDSAASEYDLNDARYVIRTKWLDLDVAQAMFPKRKALLERSIDDADSFAMMDAYGDEAMDGPEMENQGKGDGTYVSDRVTGYQRRRVRIFECWFKMPVQTPKISGGTFAGEIYDEYSPGHKAAVEEGDGEVVKKPTMRMYVALFTSAGMLWLSPSLYRHNKYPFTPIWNKRRDRDGMPYGLVRNIRDIQVDINKRASKALHILSTNKVVMDKGAVDDINELREEIAQPDSIIEVNTGKNFKFDVDRELGQWHLELMSRNIQMVQQVGGVTDENLGRSTNAVSGIAIQARQEQGALATAKLFDNHRFAQQVRGEKLLANIEQFMSDEKQFRITNMRGNPEYVTVNDGLPENDIVRTKADFIIDEQDYRATVRQAQVESLMELLGKLAPVNPQIAIVMLDLVVESMDIPQREEIVKRIRQVTGMKDPDADDQAPSPEEQQKEQAAAQQQKLQQELAMAQLRKTMSEATKNEAHAADIKAKTVAANVGSQKSALEAAGAVIMAPGIADIGDAILHESGFVSRSEGEQTMQAAAMEAQQQQAQAAQQQAAQQAQQQPQDPMAIGLGA
ncbi:hypothetical protein RHIZ_06190 [Rhizobium skierniewicense]|uniref:portal protein n=1 Tax=Rhizobium skierniewicense TaxID=984260 RepID=UPI001FAC409E|nr:hypothetical protein [Rhizobium skierniewicense]MCI9865530.1 hypothetical protein [Rhizobium skierniewicense]